jgi:outer membrane protein
MGFAKRSSPMKRLAALVALCVALPAAAQQVTKVGICDFTKVLSTAYRESKAVRDWETAKTDYRKELAALDKEITDLENQKLEADKTGNKDLSLTLEKKISDRRLYRDNFRRVKEQTLQVQAEKALSGPIVKEIMDAVNYVAETHGFALILRSDGNYGDIMLYRIMEIDITEDVIKELYTRAGKTYSSGGQ